MQDPSIKWNSGSDVEYIADPLAQLSKSKAKSLKVVTLTNHLNQLILLNKEQKS